MNGPDGGYGVTRTGRRGSLTRRTVLGGGALTVVAVGAAGLGVQQGILPGRPPGASGPQRRRRRDPGRGARPGGERLLRLGPPALRADEMVAGPAAPGKAGEADDLPLVVALHGLGEDHTIATDDTFGLDCFLAAEVAAGGPAYALATVDGGTSCWHPRPSGEDAGAMVVGELLPVLAARGVSTDRIGLLGWSMGGYGALRLAGLLGADRVAGVAAVSPAMWSDPADASRSGFADADEYDEFGVQGHQDDLAGIAVRVDCGTGDPFYRAVQDYVAGFDDDQDITASFEPGAHDAAYWRRRLPTDLSFLGAGVASSP